MLTHHNIVEELNPHEIFVFGSNLQGFHGAGAAGFASFGVSGNRWREFRYDTKPDGWKGRWNVKGQAEGLQHGTHGWGYALPTVVRPGARRSLTQAQITSSITTLYKVARRNIDWRFLIAFGLSRGLNGYSPNEMAEMFISAGSIPPNLSFNPNFAKLLTNLINIQRSFS